GRKIRQQVHLALLPGPQRREGLRTAMEFPDRRSVGREQSHLGPKSQAGHCNRVAIKYQQLMGIPELARPLSPERKRPERAPVSIQPLSAGVRQYHYFAIGQTSSGNDVLAPT